MDIFFGLIASFANRKKLEARSQRWINFSVVLYGGDPQEEEGRARQGKVAFALGQTRTK